MIKHTPDSLYIEKEIELRNAKDTIRALQLIMKDIVTHYEIYKDKTNPSVLYSYARKALVLFPLDK